MVYGKLRRFGKTSRSSYKPRMRSRYVRRSGSGSRYRKYRASRGRSSFASRFTRSKRGRYQRTVRKYANVRKMRPRNKKLSYRSISTCIKMERPALYYHQGQWHLDTNQYRAHSPGEICVPQTVSTGVYPSVAQHQTVVVGPDTLPRIAPYIGHALISIRNPAFEQLNQLAKGFDKYYIRNMKLEYSPSLGNDARGQCTIYYEPNLVRVVVPDYRKAVQNIYSTTGSIYTAMSLNVKSFDNTITRYTENPAIEYTTAGTPNVDRAVDYGHVYTLVAIEPPDNHESVAQQPVNIDGVVQDVPYLPKKEVGVLYCELTYDLYSPQPIGSVGALMSAVAAPVAVADNFHPVPMVQAVLPPNTTLLEEIEDCEELPEEPVLEESSVVQTRFGKLRLKYRPPPEGEISGN